MDWRELKQLWKQQGVKRFHWREHFADGEVRILIALTYQTQDVPPRLSSGENIHDMLASGNQLPSPPGRLLISPNGEQVGIVYKTDIENQIDFLRDAAIQTFFISAFGLKEVGHE